MILQCSFIRAVGTFEPAAWVMLRIWQLGTLRGLLIAAGLFLQFELFASSLAGTELERADPRRPVEAASCRVVLLRVPEGAVVNWIERHRAVVPPTMERVELHAAAVHKHQRSEQ